MKRLLICLFIMPALLHAQEWSVNKNAIVSSVEKHEPQLIDLSDQIWALAELAFEEYESSKLLSDYAEANGLRVTKNIAGMKTAFVAEYGSGKPIIGVLGEFDALPGISQKAKPTKDALHVGKGGHGCGHNLFGAGSLGSVIAIKELMEQGQLKGTVRFYGTPAEEKYFGKLWLAREGYFDDLDVCLDWHPSAQTKADVQSSLALVDFVVEFSGQAAHASADPWNGRSASDGLELYTTGINYFREHIKPTVRMHYHIMNGGDVVNVVPDQTKIWTRVRDTRRDGMLEVYEHVKEIARGAAIMARVDYKISLVSGLHEVLVNRTGGKAMHDNLMMLGDIEYTEAEQAFAKTVQVSTGKPTFGMDGTIKEFEETLDHPGGGSSDVGDVSWLVPEIRLAVTTAPSLTPWHSWAVVACGGMSIGHKGLLHAAKAMGMTMVDLFEQPQLVKDIRSEFNERKGDHQYEAILPEGPPPTPENLAAAEQESKERNK